MRADIYFNLHKRTWSVRDRATGRVADHAAIIYVAGIADFVVRESGRQRVLREGRKNVHAFCRVESSSRADGTPRRFTMWRDNATMYGAVRLSYNPFKGATFYRCDTGAPVHRARRVVMIAEPGRAPEVYGIPIG